MSTSFFGFNQIYSSAKPVMYLSTRVCAVACLSLAFCAQTVYAVNSSKDLCTAFGLCKIQVSKTPMRGNKMTCKRKASVALMVSPSTPLNHHLERTRNDALGILGDFASVITQSAIVASASILLVQNIPTLQLISSPRHAEIQSATVVRPPQYPEVAISLDEVRYFKLSCIRDGFEFAHSGFESPGESMSYRQCEVLRDAEAGFF